MLSHVRQAPHVACPVRSQCGIIAPFPWRILFAHKSKLSLSTLICFNDPIPRKWIPDWTHTLESVIGIYYKLISYFISGFVSAASEIMKKLFYGHILYTLFTTMMMMSRSKSEGKIKELSLSRTVSCHVPLSQKWHIKFNGNWWALIMIWDSLVPATLCPHPTGGWVIAIPRLSRPTDGSVSFPLFVFLFFLLFFCISFAFCFSILGSTWLFYHKSNFCWWSH